MRGGGTTTRELRTHLVPRVHARDARGRVLRVCGTLPGPRMACELAGSPPSCLLGGNAHGLALAGKRHACAHHDCRHYQRNGGRRKGGARGRSRAVEVDQRGESRTARRSAGGPTWHARTCTFLPAVLGGGSGRGRGHRLRRAAQERHPQAKWNPSERARARRAPCGPPAHPRAHTVRRRRPDRIELAGLPNARVSTDASRTARGVDRPIRQDLLRCRRGRGR